MARSPNQALRFLRESDAALGLDPSTQNRKWANMASNVLSFYRALPALFVADLQGPYSDLLQLLPRPAPKLLIAVDPHLGNYGTFRGPAGKPVWGMNDFDQAGTGSPELDLLRLGVSIHLAAQEIGLSGSQQRDLVEAAGQAYFSEIKSLARTRKRPETFLTSEDAPSVVVGALEQSASRAKERLSQAAAEGRLVQSAEVQPLDGTELVTPMTLFRQYQRRTPRAAGMKVLDVARRVDAGGSTFGLQRYLLLLGKGPRPYENPTLLELKLVPPSAVTMRKGRMASADAASVVTHWRALSSFVSPWAGWAQTDTAQFLVREREPERFSVGINDQLSAEDLKALGRAAATVLARAHARQPRMARELDRWVRDDKAEAAGRLGAASARYAQQVLADFAALSSQVRASDNFSRR